VKILVTGGAGFIGSHTVVELQQQGYDVWVADNLSNSGAEVFEGIRAITGKQPTFAKIDLCDLQALDDFFQAAGSFDGVVHFAAYKAVGESVHMPLKYYNNNLISTIHLLQCMEKHQCRHLVFSSSCTVYGQPDRLPVNEEAPVKKALSPYGNTKQISEEMIRDAALCNGMTSIFLRYFNPIGAHESAFIGELPLGVPNNLIPYITQTAIGKRECLNVFGNDYPTPDGTCIRDYIHVVDLAKAHVIALKRLFEKRNSETCEVFNLGTGHGNSVLEVIHSFEKISGLRLPYKIVERRNGDVAEVWSDTSKANQVLGWIAERSLDDMMDSAWKWEIALSKKRNN
jgi:UDP-glucose 4-epimerase